MRVFEALDCVAFSLDFVNLVLVIAVENDVGHSVRIRKDFWKR